MNQEEFEAILLEQDHQLLNKAPLAEHDSLLKAIRSLMPTTGILQNMFCNGFMMESVELIKHALFLYEDGYFDCAFYSLRSSVEVMNSMLLLSDDEAQLEKWKAKAWFPMDKKVKEILSNNHAAYSEIKEKIPEFFSHYDELLRTANKFIHKQGFDSFYGYYRWGKNDVESKRTDLFVDLLKHAIGMVLIMNIALDPLSLALSDPNVDSHIPFDVMTEPIPVHIFEEFLSPEIINKIKETDHYQAVKQYFMEMEELSEPTYMVVRCQHFNCSALSEIIAQEHLLNIYERLMLRILQNGIPVTRFYTDDSMLGYSTSINPIKRITHFSSNQFDPFIRDEDTINFSWNGMYISVFACLDTHLIVQHNHEFDGNAIQTIKEQIRIFNQQFQSLLDTFKSNS